MSPLDKILPKWTIVPFLTVVPAVMYLMFVMLIGSGQAPAPVIVSGDSRLVPRQ